MVATAPVAIGRSFLTVIVAAEVVTAGRGGHFLAENRRLNHTEPKPNRIVGFSVCRFGFGFQFLEVRCLGSVSAFQSTEPNNRNKPKLQHA
jgi:hypothetical protein